MKELNEFLKYLEVEKNYSLYTITNYKLDIIQFLEYCDKHKIDYKKITYPEARSYLNYLYNDENEKSSSISRKISSIRTFYRYLANNDSENFSFHLLRLPKRDKRLPKFLEYNELEEIFKVPDLNTPLGKRDSLILEMLYATGMRVSEMLHLQIFDVNLQFGYVVCHENGKERIIPIGLPCKKAMERYLKTSRTTFVKEEKETALFTNCSGKAMSRQGFWKVLKGYADDAGIKRDIAPHTLRHSFAVHMLQNGADIRSVQEMLGHSDISTTQVYLGMNMNKMRDVYMKTHPRH